jgi:type VI protein secretion system component Hcp
LALKSEINLIKNHPQIRPKPTEDVQMESYTARTEIQTNTFNHSPTATEPQNQTPNPAKWPKGMDMATPNLFIYFGLT